MGDDCRCGMAAGSGRFARTACLSSETCGCVARWHTAKAAAAGRSLGGGGGSGGGGRKFTVDSKLTQKKVYCCASAKGFHRVVMSTCSS